MIVRFEVPRFVVGLTAACLATVSCRTAAPTRKAPHGFVERGIASWYGPGFHGRRTANGERYDMHQLTAAHRSLPFGSVIEVRNRDNGKRVRVRINDRGPFVSGRIIDLSKAAARAIDMIGPGTARVEIRLAGHQRRARNDSPPATGYIVQAGAFRNAAKARHLVSELEDEYPDVRVSSGDGWHRVHLGPYARRRRAQGVVRDLGRRGIEALLRVDE